MKKIIIILVFLLSMVSIVIEVKADEELSPETETEQLLDITNDIEIRYKWYKEERVEGTYYLKGKTLKGYLEDKTITKYGKPIYDNSQICASPESYYNFSSSTSYGHSMIIEMRYVKLNKPINPENIKIYYKKNLIEYEVINQENNQITIDLKQDYLPGDIWFYIKYSQPYEIELSSNSISKIVKLSKYIENEEIIIPDKSWIKEPNQEIIRYTQFQYENNDFITFKFKRTTCTGLEILTYRYKIAKVYYDDNYHSYVEGYIKDEEDFIVLYKGKPLTNIVEITKIVKDKEIQYIELEPKKIIVREACSITSEKNNENNESIDTEEKIVTKTEYIEKEKEIKKIPKYIYIIIVVLILIIIYETIKILKKKVD